MAIRQLQLTDFRNLLTGRLEFHPQLNLVHGPNGSGKTSLLEAIHIVSQGRSFKTTKLEQCTRHTAQEFVLFAQYQDNRVGLRRRAAKTEVHIDGETINRLSVLAKTNPIRCFHSGSYQVVEGSPSHRRAFIDWSLFHVEQNYQSQWLAFSHALKQRNALLKAKGQRQQLPYWDEQLAKFSRPIHTQREQSLDQLKDYVEQQRQNLLQDIPLELTFSPGWDERRDMLDVLTEQRERDIRLGYTQYGPHRDDFHLKINGSPVSQILSRGQVKRLAMALFIAQLTMVKQLTGINMIILVDDLMAELDEQSASTIMTSLKSIGTQLFISSIEQRESLFSPGDQYQMFHVEHGMISPVKYS